MRGLGWVWIGFMCLLIGYFLPSAIESCSSPIVEAQEPWSHGDDALCAARVCVREAGWNSPRDCAAILQVLRATSRDGETICERLARVGRLPREDRRWAAALPLDPHSPWPPEGWPSSTASWEDYRPRWARVLAVHRRWLAGGAPQPCRPTPTRWGGPMDDHLAARQGLERVECGATLNRFYRTRADGT